MTTFIPEYLVSKSNIFTENPYKPGYGSKIPTPYSVYWRYQDGKYRWLKVYAMCHSNVASYYILPMGKFTFIDFVGAGL